MSYIHTVHTLLPSYSYSLDEVKPYFQKWVHAQGKDFSLKALRILNNAGIEKRHTIAPLDVLFSERSFEESNNLYRQKAIEFGTRVLKETLDKASLRPSEIDCLITTSCTGFMIPSFDAYVMDALGLKSTLRQIPITEVGCAAGVAALIYADDYLKAYPTHTVAIITLEFPSNTIQLQDYSWDNVVGTALFADGVSCAILSGQESSLKIIDTQMTHFSQTAHLLGYHITDHGLRMNLDKGLPDFIETHLIELLTTFICRQSLSLSDISDVLVHPGGIKILDRIEKCLSFYGHDVHLSRLVMQQHGNMSSSTILFILAEYFKEQKISNYSLLLSFGPGFSAHQVLLKKI